MSRTSKTPSTVDEARLMMVWLWRRQVADAVVVLTLRIEHPEVAPTMLANYSIIKRLFTKGAYDHYEEEDCVEANA